MFDTFIVQPIFNVLVLIYALLPGHNFGAAIIVFTILIRLLMWPLLKKQLHHAKAMRELQPELKRIKQATKGDRQKEQLMTMELYKERQINPFSSLGLIIIQLPIFLALYSGLNRIVQDPNAILDFAYSFVRDLGGLSALGENIARFDNTLFGLVDLSRAALGDSGLYLPAMLIVVASVVVQFFQGKQLLPDSKDSKGLRQIFRDAQSGTQSDSSEMNAAMGQFTRYLLPAFIFIFTVRIASALSLYWLVSGAVAYLQQSRILGRDEEELEKIADRKSTSDPKNKRTIIEGEVIAPKKVTNTDKNVKKKKKSSKASKRRKK